MPPSVGREASHRPPETKSANATSSASVCTSGTESGPSFQTELDREMTQLETEQPPGSGQPPTDDAAERLLLLQQMAANGGLPAGSTVTRGFQAA